MKAEAKDGAAVRVPPPLLYVTAVALAAIRHEVAYLEGKFGAAHLECKRSVRRWV